MIVKLISIIAALGATVASAAPVPPNFVMALDCSAGINNCEVSRVNDPATCGATLFLDHSILCYNKDYAGDILNRLKGGKAALDDDQLTILLGHYGGIGQTGESLSDAFDLIDRNTLGKNLLEKVTKDTVESFAAHPDTMKHFVDLLGGDVLANSGNLTGLLEAISNKPRGKAIFVAAVNKLALAQAGPKAIRDNSAWLLAQINARAIQADLLTPEVWKNITDNGDDCKSIPDATLSLLLESANHAKILKAACVKECPKINLGCGVQIRNMPLEVMKNSPSMEKKCYEYLSTDQVAVLDESKPEDERCTEYPLEEKVVRANGSKMASACFEGALSATEADHPSQIGQAWSLLPTNVLSFKEKTNYEKLAGDDLHYIPAAHKAPIFATAEGCERAPSGILTYHAEGVRISGDCFKELRSDNQADAIIGADVEKDCLKGATIAKVKEWTRGDDKGLAVLNHALDRKDIAALVEHLNPEVCATIETLEELREARAIQMYGQKNCFDEMKEALSKVRLSDMRELEGNARSMIDMNEFIKGMGEENYNNMEDKDFRMLQDNSNICDVMKGDQVGLLPSGVLTIINGNCLARILSRGEVIERRTLAQIPPTAFTKLEGQHLKHIKDELTPEQFGVASSEVASLEHHFAATWTSADVAKISGYNMKYIHVSAWKAAPEEAYAGFNKQNFPHIPPPDIRVMTLPKLQQVPRDVRATLTELQAKELDPTALPAFNDLQLPATVRKILDEALAANKPKAEASPAG